MTPEERAYVNYRMERAFEARDEAQVLLEAGHYSASANRLYYACFYAVSALLLAHGMSSVKHAGVRDMFNQSFVRTGKVTKNLGRFYNRLFVLRHKCDYEDLFKVSRESLANILSDSDLFLATINALIQSAVGVHGDIE